MASNVKYDEDVYDNPYFMGILSTFPSYVGKVVAAKGILCIPKYSIAVEVQPNVVDIEDHILVPTKEVVDDADDFVTVSGKVVKIREGRIIGQQGFDCQREASILFAETFHTDDGGSYRVFCIGGFLNRTVDLSPKNSGTTKTISPANYQHSVDMLWSHSGGQKSRDALDKMLTTLAPSYSRLEGENLRSIVDAANTHFTKSMQLMLKDSYVRRAARHNDEYMENLKVAVETYLMNAVHISLFRVITATFATQDAEINKITRNLFGLQLTDLGIRKVFNQNILPAKKELSGLNRFSTPMGRLFCIKRVVAALTKPPKNGNVNDPNDTAEMMTTDDLLPILIFLIIKSETPNWMANLVYMRHFHFAKSSDDDEFGFYLATVEAALEHIRSGNIKDDIKPVQSWTSFLVSDGEDVSLTSSPSSCMAQAAHGSKIDHFFQYVQDGAERQVTQMLERPKRTSEELHLQLCHPLCACDACDKLLVRLRSDSDLVTAYTRDNRGYTALHIASYYGQGILIDLLVQHQALVDATDYLGLTPLHLACQRGYQNVMLLLLHFGADCMALDNEGNTPLHLCCANGHEDCVKALVFYDASLRKIQINKGNEFGDTPLHLAAKWGYESIVRSLLENGADATLRNRKRQTPVSMAQNVIVQRWLEWAAEGDDYQPFRPVMSPPKPRLSRSSSSSTPNSPQSRNPPIYEDQVGGAMSLVETTPLEAATEEDRRRRKERLFKAIIEGDIQLVKFYLGVQTRKVSEGDEEEDNDVVFPGALTASVADMCHPLCQCDTCRGIEKVQQRQTLSLPVNTRTSTGYCPLHMAVLHGHSDIVALLIGLRANLSVQNHKGLTPLHLAQCQRNSLITDLLLRGGARLDAQDMNGDTPLLIASSNGFINGVNMLIRNKANLDLTNIRGNSALHESLKRDQLEVAILLLGGGADPRVANRQGRKPEYFTADPTLRAALITKALRLTERESIVAETNLDIGDLNDNKEPEIQNMGQISIKELFAAFEESDLHTLKSLNKSVRSFDAKNILRHTKTKDRSSSILLEIAKAHSIKSFNKGSLRKIQSSDKGDPMYIYSLTKSKSCDDLANKNVWNNLNVESEHSDQDSLTNGAIVKQIHNKSTDSSLSSIFVVREPIPDESISFEDQICIPFKDNLFPSDLHILSSGNIFQSENDEDS